MPDRRAFLSGMLAAGLWSKSTWADVGAPAFLSAARNPDGSHALFGLDTNGGITFEVSLPGRGHAAAAHPLKPQAIAFARRPGRFAVVIDCVHGRVEARLSAPPGRHFSGHGAYSASGESLFTTENDFEAARGVIGVWDVPSGYARIAEIPSGGVGPHDIKLMPGGKLLAVANGGIETHPDTGRVKLNIPTMRPNLGFVTLDGRVQEIAELDDSLLKNSIRHLAVGDDGTVAVAMQWQGDKREIVPVLGIHRFGRPIRLIESVRSVQANMKGYAGSVAISNGAENVAVTSPRGNTVQVFRTSRGKIEFQDRLEDVCGIARGDGKFFATSGIGKVCVLENGRMMRLSESRTRWDNHLVEI